MPTTTKAILALMLLVLGYALGRFVIPPRVSNGVEERTESSVSILEGSVARTGSGFRQVSGLLAKQLTHESRLTIQKAALDMDANEFERLWESRKHAFNYTSSIDLAVARDILKQLAQVDPESALAKIPDVGTAKYEIIPAILQGWSRTDLQGALDWARLLTDPRARHAGLGAIIDETGLEDPNAAVDLYMEALEDKAMPASAWTSMDAFFRRWAKLDPEGASNKALYLREHGFSPESAPFRNALKGALQAWAYQDPAAASRWLQARVPESLQEDAYATLAESWAESSPIEAAEFALAHEATNAFADPLERAIGQWVRRDFGEAAAWVDAIEDPERRQQLQGKLLDLSRQHVAADRDQAMAYAAGHLDNPQVVTATQDHLERMIREGETESAKAWTRENVADPEQRATMEKKLMESLMWRRPNEVPKHADLIPEGRDERESIHASTAFQWAKREPDDAKAWMDALPTDERTDRVLLGFARGWLEADRQAASKWIDSNALTDGQRSVSMTDELTSLRSMAAMREHQIDESLALAQEIEHPHLRDVT